MQHRSPLLPLLAVWTCVTLWSFSGILVKSTEAPPLIAASYRLWFGVGILWTLALARGRLRFDREYLRLCAIGGGFFGLHQIFFFASLDNTLVANVNLIASLQPALVAFLASRWFDEPTPWDALPQLGVALVGVAVVITASSGLPGVEPYGDALAILNLLSFTGYFLASKRIRNHLGTAEYITGMTTVAAIVLSLTLPLTGQFPSLPSARDAAILFSIALLPGTVGHMLMNWAHPYLSAFTISTTILAVPVISAFAANAFLYEPITVAQIVGGAVALTAVGTILRRVAAPG